VKASSWREGKGDVVREFADACRKQGLKFGVYLSPWDRNHKDYGTPSYITYYRNQLRELLTGYGDLFMVWFDGAMGGDGYYGGAREKRTVDNRIYYGWPETWAQVRAMQPKAVMFSDAGPDVRWVGNESGRAGDPCWATLNLAGCYPGMADSSQLNKGNRNGTDWVPPECDVPLRKGWFYHPQEDNRVKTPSQLLRIYYESIGRGAGLDLGLAPDKRGLLSDPDIAALRGMRRLLDLTFATNLADSAKANASNVRAGNDRFGPGHLLDGNQTTYWATDDGVTNADVVLDLGKATAFNVVRLCEFLPLGQRVDEFALDQWQDDKWNEFAKGSSIGNQRLMRTPSIRTEKVRLRIVRASVCPAISELGLFMEPEEARTAANGRP
jgi:alpha-L-fucosidase